MVVLGRRPREEVVRQPEPTQVLADDVVVPVGELTRADAGLVRGHHDRRAVLVGAAHHQHVDRRAGGGSGRRCPPARRIRPRGRCVAGRSHTATRPRRGSCWARAGSSTAMIRASSARGLVALSPSPAQENEAAHGAAVSSAASAAAAKANANWPGSPVLETAACTGVGARAPSTGRAASLGTLVSGAASSGRRLRIAGLGAVGVGFDCGRTVDKDVDSGRDTSSRGRHRRHRRPCCRARSALRGRAEAADDCRVTTFAMAGPGCAVGLDGRRDDRSCAAASPRRDCRRNNRRRHRRRGRRRLADDGGRGPDVHWLLGECRLSRDGSRLRRSRSRCGHRRRSRLRHGSGRRRCNGLRRTRREQPERVDVSVRLRGHTDAEMDVRRRCDRVGARADDADDRALRDDVASPHLRRGRAGAASRRSRLGSGS